MIKTKKIQLDDFIVPININGLHGRMLRLPSPKARKREILLIYGQHSNLERYFGLAELFNDFGGVTMPDLPGFGGMGSFYKIGEKPTLDNLADYMATFIKLRYRGRRLSIAAISFGFAVVTRMLQKYPDIAKKIDLVISISGYVRHDEFNLGRSRYFLLRFGSWLLSSRLLSVFFRNIALHPYVIRGYYKRFAELPPKLSASDQQKIIDFEVYLWRCNDLRTHMYTTNARLRLDNCTGSVKIPVWYVHADMDVSLDSAVVEQHMQVVFSDFHAVSVKREAGKFYIFGDKKTARKLISPQLRHVLRQI
ncbi:alpha/beta hydrolase [Candidatus Saccharibacteria bacterium]|nr:alpha/beta hydrolase [Candidatus Saccharibacteria bacterium]MBI3337993.1 alpha/beta hydrolase [Candidatus Saccharibacteria bacterium]